MCVYIDIINSTILERRLNNNTWQFETNPNLPLQRCVEIEEMGWDIPTRCVLDNSGQWWEDNGHGHFLKKTKCSPYLGSEIKYIDKIPKNNKQLLEEKCKLERNSKNNKIRVVVYVKGGVVQDILTDTENVDTMIVDYDSEEEEPVAKTRDKRCFDATVVNKDYINKTINYIED